MNLKTLIASLIIGSSTLAASSAAMASPVSVAATASARERYEAPASITFTHRPVLQTVQPLPTPPIASWTHNEPSRGWTVLTAAINLEMGKPETFRVDAKLDKLELQQLDGSSQIKTVTIEYANGRCETVNVDQRLWSSNPTITLPIHERMGAVRSVQLAGHSNEPASFRILGIV